MDGCDDLTSVQVDVLHQLAGLEGWLFPDAPVFERWAAAEARSCGITDGVEIRDRMRRAARMLNRFQVTDLYEELDELLAKRDEDGYVVQVARYLDATEELLSIRPSPVLCFLNYAGQVRLVRDRW